ncbi:DUF6879 family protein [Kutzneria sp. NPDC052558]|uniref:DUF6879 family protein n=1 Tax=Kutzneria sp. NPDC052558 TaxID=3364121 RepID=UPI0037C8E81E
MTDLITGEEFDALFAAFRRTAWRWEAQASYHEPYELGPLERWRRGEPDDLAWMADWLGGIRAATDAGRLFQRVRLYTEPPTEYLRWQENITPANVEAGEDIRIVTADQAAELELPGHDFWLFDDDHLVRMHFDASGFVGGEMITEPGTVAQHRAWRDIAWTHAVPYWQYRETHPVRGAREQQRPGQAASAVRRTPSSTP